MKKKIPDPTPHADPPIPRSPDIPTELRLRAEEKARAYETQAGESLSPEATRQTLHELRVHQIELEMQNEELRRTQAELEAARARYFELYDLAPVGYCTLSKQGLILEANLTAATLLGVTRSALTQQPISRFIPKEDQIIYYLHRKRLFETGEPQACELRMMKNDGTAFWAQMEAAAARDPSTLRTDSGQASSGQDADGVPVCRVVISDITERKRAEDALRASLEEKVVLLKEVHHRVKNNLQIVASLLHLQAGRSTNAELVEAMNDVRNRVHSMALLHETLYRAENLARVNFAAYVEDLCKQLLRSFGPTAARIALKCDVAHVGLRLEQSVPCGLIVNELVSNALKHGFPGDRAGSIFVELRPAEKQTLILSVRDDGVGLPPGFEPASSTTLGLRLVSTLAEQLGGQLTVKSPAGAGATFSVAFPVPANTLCEGET